MSNKRVLITGASSGLGKALAHDYHKLGWIVYGLSRSEMPDFIIPIQEDIVNSSSVLCGLSKVLQNLQLDLCILNAGTLGPVDNISNISIAEIEESIKINCTSNKPILDHLITFNKLQSVIAISSGAAIKAYEGWGCYCISKATLEMFIKVYANEYPNINWVCLSPGLVKSPMQDEIQKIDIKKFPQLKKFQDHYPSMSTPEEVSKNILEHISSIEGAIRIDLRDIINDTQKKQ